MGKSLPFVKIDELSTMLEKTVDNYISGSTPEIDTTFSSANLSECPRRLVYRGLSYPSTIKRAKRLDNIEAKNKWIGRFSEISEIKLLDKNVIASDCNYNVSALIDMVLNVGGLLLTVSIKPIANEEFLSIKTEGVSKKHVTELLINMWLMEMKDGLLIYENKNDNSFIFFHVIEYPLILTSIQKKCRLMFEYKTRGVIPNRPYKNKNENECGVCEFNKTCWTEKGDKDGTQEKR